MNIFDIYLEKIIKIISEEGKKSSLKIPDNLNSINVGIPPQKFDSDISTTTMIKDNHRPCLPVPLDQRLALPENGGNFVNEDPLSCDQVNCSVEKLWEVPTSAPVNYRDPNIPVNYSTDMNPLNNNGNTVPVEPFSTQWRQNNLQSL